jgi:hypothetical protein
VERSVVVLGLILRVLTAVFWVVAPICVVVIAASAFTESAGAWLLWTTGVSMLLVVRCSGGIAWAEFQRNPIPDAERGEWTNKALFYAIVFTITFIVAFLYLPTLFFAR